VRAGTFSGLETQFRWLGPFPLIFGTKGGQKVFHHKGGLRKDLPLKEPCFKGFPSTRNGSYSEWDPLDMPHLLGFSASKLNFSAMFSALYGPSKFGSPLKGASAKKIGVNTCPLWWVTILAPQHPLKSFRAAIFGGGNIGGWASHLGKTFGGDNPIFYIRRYGACGAPRNCFFTRYCMGANVFTFWSQMYRSQGISPPLSREISI